jgi:transposase
MSRVEIFRGQAPRRWSDEAKRRLVAETLVPGATVHAVAQRHGVNTSQLFTWRKRFRTESGLPTAVPVAPAFAVVEVAPVLEARAETGEAAPHSDAMMAGGVIEIELPKGRRVRISGRVEPAVVTAALRALVRR